MSDAEALAQLVQLQADHKKVLEGIATYLQRITEAMVVHDHRMAAIERAISGRQPTAGEKCELTEEPNEWGCHDPQCHDSTWDHACPVGPCTLPEHGRAANDSPA